MACRACGIERHCKPFPRLRIAPLYPSWSQEDTFWYTTQLLVDWESCHWALWKLLCTFQIAKATLTCPTQVEIQWNIIIHGRQYPTSSSSQACFLDFGTPLWNLWVGANCKWLILIYDFTSQILFLLAYDLGLKMWSRNTYFPLGSLVLSKIQYIKVIYSVSVAPLAP